MNHRRVRGRHRRSDVGGRGLLTGLLVLVAAGGVVTSMVMTGGGDPAVPAPARTGTSAATADEPDAGAPLRACETAVAKGRDAVAAARPSYSHWAGHVRAQLDYDAGTATLEQTRERWAATRATADADLADFATAHAAFEAVQDGCTPTSSGVREAVARQPGGSTQDDPDPAMTQCRAEFDSVSDAVTAAKAVVDDWAAHVAMMKGKEHYGANEYGQMWRDMVEAAPADLDRFARASLAMSDHVDCPRPV
jgi:hypothetical protein